MSLLQHCSIRNILVFVPAVCLILITLGGHTTRAQKTTTPTDFWPEVDVYIDLKPKFRLYLLATVSKSLEDGEFRNAEAYEAQVGAHIDFIPNKHIILRAGYRFGSSVGNTSDPFKEHRFLTEQTLRASLPGGLLLSDRNRQDFRFVDGDFSFRYRNRLTIEKEFHLFRERNITPYASGEIFYDTRYGIWNRNRYAFGIQTSLLRGPIRKMLLPKRQVILDLFFMRQNDSRSDVPHLNGLGAALQFYF